MFYIRLYTLSKLFEKYRFAWCDFDSLKLEISLLQIVKYLLTIISYKFSNRVNKCIFSINAIITCEIRYDRRLVTLSNICYISVTFMIETNAKYFLLLYRRHLLNKIGLQNV